MHKSRSRKPRFWRICRIYFRRFRIAVWLLILTLLTCVIYLNQIGLPDFVKTPLLQKLRARGIDLEFERLRFSWIGGVVADDVRFGPPGQSGGPHLTVQQVQLQLNRKALARFRLQVDALRLHQGRLIWPVADTNDVSRELSIENIDSNLRLLPNDQWALDGFDAVFAGAKVRLSGMVTNASHVRDWPLWQPDRPKVEARQVQNRVKLIADTLDRIQFSKPPELKFDLSGDARDLLSFRARFSITAPGAETPWGSVAGGRFTALMFPATNGLSRAELTLVAAHSETRWASITNFHLKMDLATTEEQTDLVSGALQLSASQASTPWCSASDTVVSAEWIHSITNPIPLSGRANISCADAHTRWASAGHVDLDLRLLTSTASASPSASLGWWTNVLPFQAEWTCRAKKLKPGQVVLAMVAPSSARSGPNTTPSADVVLDSATISGSWQAPELSIRELNTTLYNAALQAKARLNIDTRAAAASVATDVDARKLFPLLPESARRWLRQFTWQRPPQARAEASLILPPWTGHDPDWRKDVLPTLNLEGDFKLQTNGTYRGLQVSAASSRFHFSNLRWHLPDLTVFRPEGRVIAEHRADEQTKDFYWRIDSTVDPAAVKPLLEPSAQRAFDLAWFEMPPKIQGEIWGRSKAPERTGFKASVQLTNFSFRGQSGSSLETRLTFTNKLLACIEPKVTRTNQFASADALIVDFNVQKIYLTNGFSTMDPMVVAKAIGASTARAIEPYTFRSPPTARVYGIIPMRGEEDANLHFDIQGEGFHWWKFNMESMSGHVHWAGERVFLKDVVADFYQGKAAGFANFDFSKPHGTDFEFAATVTNALLQFLIADLSPGTNRLEGRLHGTVAVTSANTEDWRSVHGYGTAQLQDGLVWDIPLFGIFSPLLNSVSPGLGNSRVTAASCTFNITNGVIRSDNLEFRAQAMRLQYRGTIDLENRLDARVEAELLRDMWIVGPLVSTVFWPVTKMFEYRVSGSLSQPVMEPVYLFPKLMMLPFHPLRTLKNLFPDDASSRSNAPPGGR